MIYVVADHGGFAAKQRLARWLKQRGERVVDLGADKKQPTDDYPDFAVRLARAVRRHPDGRGIALCRSGIGMAMVANKISGIRAAQVFTPRMAKRAKEDEDANVISIGADYHSQKEIQVIVNAWLTAKFRPSQKYKRRLAKIKKLDHGR